MRIDFAMCEQCQSELAYWHVLPQHLGVRGIDLVLCESCLCDLVQDVAFGAKWSCISALTVSRL